MFVKLFIALVIASALTVLLVATAMRIDEKQEDREEREARIKAEIEGYRKRVTERNGIL